MKNIQIILSVAIAGLVLTFSAGAQDVKQGIATVVRVKGPASYTLGNDDWHPLVVGKVLRAGATVKTGPGGMVDMVLGKTIDMPQARPTPDNVTFAPDSPVRGLVGYRPSAEQNVVRLSGDTTLGIDKLTTSDTGADTVSDTELDLKQGRIFGSVKKLSASSQYLVKIPKGIAGVRGTWFTLSADGSSAVIKGSLLESLVNADGIPVTILVNEGMMYNPENGQTTAISPDLLNLLDAIAAALNTTYFQLASFTSDSTIAYISPVVGPPYVPRTTSSGGSGGEQGVVTIEANRSAN